MALVKLATESYGPTGPEIFSNRAAQLDGTRNSLGTLRLVIENQAIGSYFCSDVY